MQKTCFFIGHRDAPDSLLPRLTAEVERHITEYGVTDFVVGGYGNFDALAARAVRRAKKEHPSVTLFRLLAYHPAERAIPTPPGFDGTFYPEGMERVPKRAAIVRANRYMVDHSGYLIAWTWHPASGARDLADYARRREKRGLIRVTQLAAPEGAPAFGGKNGENPWQDTENRDVF